LPADRTFLVDLRKNITKEKLSKKNSSSLSVLHLDSLKPVVKELQKVSGISPDTPRTIFERFLKYLANFYSIVTLLVFFAQVV